MGKRPGDKPLSGNIKQTSTFRQFMDEIRLGKFTEALEEEGVTYDDLPQLTEEDVIDILTRPFQRGKFFRHINETFGIKKKKVKRGNSNNTDMAKLRFKASQGDISKILNETRAGLRKPQNSRTKKRVLAKKKSHNNAFPGKHRIISNDKQPEKKKPVSVVAKKNQNKAFFGDDRQQKESNRAKKKSFTKIPKMFKGKQERPKFIISSPKQFKSSMHIGVVPGRGFVHDNLPPEWKGIFESAGISKENFEDPTKAARMMKAMKKFQKKKDPKKQSPKTATVMYDFDGTDDEELTVKEGETVTVLKDVGEWLFVRNTAGAEGYVPTTYVEQ